MAKPGQSLPTLRCEFLHQFHTGAHSREIFGRGDELPWNDEPGEMQQMRRLHFREQRLRSARLEQVHLMPVDAARARLHRLT